jgi:chemotaxis protein CheX
MSRIKSADIKIFSDAAGTFFYQTTGIRATVRTAYILDETERFNWNDFQSRIDLGGQYTGMVAFSAPRALLSSVLHRLGEHDYSNETHNDVTGEIANQMSGYVRRHFGEGMHISPPTTIRSDEVIDKSADGSHAFIIPMTWEGYEAKLLVKIGKVS